MAPMVVNFAPAPPAQQETFQHLVPTQRGINLSMLIDFLLQKTYHDLTVLSELLPRKSDIDRKIEIIQFATKARQQFIRMLALVKWASTADRVDKCQAISSYLDQQNAYFIDTADTLARIARETLVQARLPNFSLPTAVDVLTTGTFNRLPKCIKTKIIPDEPISADDKARTLKRLNEVIQHRLVISNIPQQFTTIRINDGKVRLKVENEFEVVLMLMGDEKSIPWRLLNIEFLMEDYQTGDGKALVHGMQVHYIHQIVQSRLMADEDPLVDLYKTLHDVDYFCLSLQLEILHTQAKRLIGQRWGEYVSVDQYVPGKKLSISFCRCLLASASAAVKASPPSLTVEATADYSSLIVNLQSDPQSDTSESGAIKLSCSCLSIEKIYSVIFKQYSASKLHQLLEQLQKKPFYMSSCRLDDAMPCITIKPYECGAGENVLITIDSRSGLFLLKVNENIKPSLIQQLQDILQSDLEAFTEGFHQLRCHLFLERNKRSVMLLPVHIYDHLPITNLESHALSTFPKTKIFLHFKRHPGYCLVSTVDVSSDDDKNIVENYYLIKLHSNVANTDQGNTSRNTTDGNIGLNATFFYFAEVPIKLKTNAFSRPNVIQKDELSILFGLKKRKKLLDQEETDVTNKKTNFAMTATPIQKEKDASSPFNKSLSNMVTESYLRIPYIKVTKQLSDAKVVFDGVVMEDDSNYVVHLLDIPLLENCRQDVQLMLKKLLLKASVSYDHEVNNWVVGYSFSRPSITCARQLLCEDVVFTYDENSECTIASLILSGWKELVKMYQQAHDVDAVVKASAQYFTLENLSLLKYDMKSLLFSYCKDYMVSFTYDGLNNKYAIHFLENGLTRGKCPHNLTKAQLAQEFNTHEDIQYTLKIIHDTYAPLNSISKISILPALGISNRVLSVVNNFTIISHSSTRVKIIYRNVYTLDVYFMESTVLLRDGTYYRTDSTKAMRGFTTIPQLTNFLRLYADKAFANSLLVGYDFPFTPGASELDHQSEHFAPPSYDSSLKEKSVRSPAVVMSSPQTLGNTHFTAPSPGNPYNVASPGPFLQPSPAQVTMSPSPWPGSPPLVPGSPRPVKHGLNQLSSINVSHAPIPVVLTHAAFNMLLKPVKHDKSSPVRNPMKLSPLERFFGSTVLHTHLLRVLRTDDTLKLEKKEHGVVIFSGTGKNGPETGLQYSIRLNPSAMDFLILRITPIKGYENAWIPDELKVLEQFFEMKVSKEVVCSPYKVCALTAFARILGTQPKIMKDFIKIMKLELQTDWTDYAFRVEWCLTVPPGDVPSLALPGTPAVVLKAKNLIFLQLTEVKNEEHTVTITLVHDLKTNLVHNLEFPRQPNAPPEPITWAVRAKSALQVLLSKIAEHISKKESPIYCVVVTILKHLQVK